MDDIVQHMAANKGASESLMPDKKKKITNWLA